jgi:hypothetical protein
MRRIVVLILACLAAFAVAVADEGMWMPGQLPELGDAMKAAGLEVDATSLSDLTAHPMGAVIWLGGCTASFVSDQGLVVTNHHCAYGSIQHNSTEENNILEDGFLAGSFEEELSAAPGSRVLVTTRVEDVTDRVLGAVPENASGKTRYDAIEAAEKALVAECEKQDGVRCRVSSFYGGVIYQRFTQLEIRDVRLVYAPARSVGKYGGDVDNWMWPRHTGDFSFLRAYVGPDGRPAEPAPENVPYRPKHRLRLATDGVDDGDFVMVAGYPGRTNRYRLADEVENRIGWSYPMALEVYGALLASVEQAVEKYPDAELKVAPLVAGLNNMTKNYTGMLAGFDRVDVAAAKREMETELASWIAADQTRTARYGTALDDLRELVAEDQLNRERDLYWGIVRRSTMLRAASRLYRLAHENLKPDMEREPGYQERDLSRMRRSLERMESTYDRRVDRWVWGDAIRMYAALPADKRVAVFDKQFGIGADGVDSNKLDAVLDAMYANTGLESLETRLEWMDASVEAFQASDDPFIRLAVALYPVDLEMEAEDEALTGRFEEARPRFMEALIAHQRSLGLPVYPDANSTLRVTTGHIAGYSPRDGVLYAPFTTLEGLLEKETGVEPFDSPEPLLQAVRDGDRGPYGLDSLGSVPLDFLSTVDTTGGNSGSPTLNGRGELVGLLFDGAWESLLSDWYYEPDRVRSIHTDVRYMLWVMDRVDGAHRLLREMGIKPSFAAE